ncbi:flagellar biosynthetic protein FliO [Chitinivorax sp. B]|uniref:flagellar biosynthetic protein FliO n=1 Tax=Chitinivorax sp. B TaxID=2502235 RepID=UPI0010FA43D2|nr:flagellar biosynthetic protein FliO [Chitinivorax sp. B]
MRAGSFLISFILPVFASAAETGPVAQSAGSLLQVFLALAIVLSLIAGCAWLLKKLTPGGLVGGAGMRVIGGVMVGPKERVVVVELADTWLILGVTSSQVNTLHTLPKPADADQLIGPKNEAPFAKWLSGALQKRNAHAAGVNSVD